MFDFGFTELMIIALIGLVVLGPERLPKVARTVGQWMGKLRRYVDDVKSDLNRQMDVQELKDLQTQMTDAARDLQSSVQSSMGEVQASLDEVRQSVEGADPVPAPTDWDRVYAVRRSRQRIKDRRIEREQSLGIKRPKRPLHR